MKNSLKTVFSMSPSVNEDMQQRPAASLGLVSGAPVAAPRTAVSALQPPQNAASFVGGMRLVPTSVNAQQVGANATVALPVRPVTSSLVTGDQSGTPLASQQLASPGIEPQILHQLNDERRAISGQAPFLVSTTINESTELLVAPFISDTTQETTSSTAQKLVAGTSTTSADRTPKVGVTFRTDEPTTYSHRQRQHQAESGHLQTLYRTPANFWPTTGETSTRRPTIQPSGMSYFADGAQTNQRGARILSAGNLSQNCTYPVHRYPLSPSHPTQTPYGNEWASDEPHFNPVDQPRHFMNQADTSAALQQAVSWLSSLGYQISPRRYDECSPATFGQPNNTVAAINPRATDEFDCLKLLPSLSPINPDDLQRSLKDLIDRFKLLGINDSRRRMFLAAALFPTELVSQFTREVGTDANFDQFTAFIFKQHHIPDFSIHQNFPRETSYAQAAARARADMACPPSEIFKFHLAQRAPVHIRASLREHFYLEEEQFHRYAKFVFDNPSYISPMAFTAGRQKLGIAPPVKSQPPQNDLCWRHQKFGNASHSCEGSNPSKAVRCKMYDKELHDRAWRTASNNRTTQPGNE